MIKKDAKLKYKIQEKAEELKYTLDLIIEEPSMSEEVKSETIIHATALICAIVAIQPLPFADLFILSPIQVVMVTYLSKVLGINEDNIKPKEIVVYLVGTVGWGVLSQQAILGLYKTIIPYAGGITTIPLVYMATYGLGRACKVLIKSKMENKQISKSSLKKIRDEAIEEIKRENRNFSIEAIKHQFENIKPIEFESYKQKLIACDEKLNKEDNKFINDDIYITLLEKEKYIKDRFDKYKNVQISDNIIANTLIFTDKDEMIEVERIIAKIDRNEVDLKFSIGNTRYHDKLKKISSDIEIDIERKNNKYYITNIFIDTLRHEEIRKKFNRNSSKIEHIKNEEIRKRFMNAIDIAEYEINISSPWLSESVVNANLINKIEKSLKKGVKIKILYGIEGNNSYNTRVNYRTQNSDNIALNLSRKFNEFGENFKIKKVNTHYKVLICDEKFYIEGSYNFLSFSGEYKNDKRCEGATYGEDKDYIRKLRREYFEF